LGGDGGQGATVVQRWFTGGGEADAWALRLEAIGAALDRYPQRLSCIAVSMTEESVLVSALAWHDGTRHSGWESVTLRIEQHRAVPLPPVSKLALAIDEPA
jgi:hypothetical protein